jgi:hypothetical protein
MNNAEQQIIEPWFGDMIEDCKGILTEGIFNSRWELLRTYHELGVRIKEDHGEFERAKIYGQRLCDTIANSLSIKPSENSPGYEVKPRLIYQCLQFVEKYPDINALPEGKNCSWSKIVKKYLPAHKENKPEKPTLEKLIDQFIADIFPGERKERKKFIAEIVTEWENYEP